MPDFAEHLKNMINSAAVAAAMFDTEMCYLAWSKRWSIDYRLGARDLLGLNHYEVFPELKAEWKAIHRRCLAGAVENQEEQAFPRADGRVEFVRWSVHPWYNERNQVGGLIIFAEVVTRQRRVEEALMVSERHLSTIFQESPVALSVSDFETGRFLDVNTALLDLMRATASDQLVGQTSRDVGMITPEDRVRLVRAVVAQGRVEGFLTKMQRLDGESFMAELYVSSYVEGGGRFLLTSIVDVTERKRAEEETAASRALYRALFEAANDAVFLHGVRADGTADRFVAVNNVAVEMLGFSEEEFRQLTPADIDAGSHAEERCRALERLSTEGNATFEMLHVAKDGRRVPVEISSRRFVLGDDPFILSIARDITARKHTEAEIARLATAIEQAVETILITDDQAHIVYANPALEKSSGYPVAELLGKNPRILQSGKHDPAFYKEMWDALGRGETWRGRLQNKRKDGTLYLEDASISPVRDKSGRVVNYIALKLDVTRESELQAQLLQAQKMESIGRLAGGVAHDFNNMLTVINGYSKLALEGLKPGDPLRDKLDEIRKAGERAAGLTRQLLAFSRKQILQPRLLNLNCVVEDMRKMLESLVGEDVEVRFSLCTDTPAVNADPHQLQQVIMNLAVNARDAMRGGGSLTIETAIVERDENCAAVHPEAHPGCCAMLSVSDTGMGMDEETRQRIFEPFFTTKGPGEGTGLGLSIVQGVVAQSGGCVRLWSEPGHGTTFKIYLPLLAETMPVTEKAPAVTVLSGHETILVVEDQAEVRNFTAAALQGYGYHVMVAADADEALMICGQSGARIHLVLTDVVMPHTSGPELAARLREIRPGMKIVFMSGYADDVILRRGPQTEGSNFIMKPFSPEELAGKVRDALGSEVSGPEVRAKRVLVADDEGGVRSFIRAVLESDAYEVAEAADGKQAMRYALAERVDLVITDLVMPEQEGIETIRALRRELPDIRIIATSGAFNGQFLGVAKMLGADGALSKPFSPEALLAKVEEVMTSTPRVSRGSDVARCA